ncbi:DUF721 domain-containing protein [Methylophaga sp.]|uniref:DUF721 domain-containing protein n=1 Tax=Methylophaga sp. TaxID=2024840 RepID=UPI003F69BE26
MSNKPEHVGGIYKQDSRMKWLATRAQQLNKLNIVLQNTLPLQFSSHCQLANVTADTVIIHTDKASYASLLRFQAPLVCKTLSAHLPEPVSKLEVKVRPLQTLSEPTTHASIHVSTKTAALLNSTAEEIEDGPLKTALKKLASRQSD